MQGLRGQQIDWAGVDGVWYALVVDPTLDIHVNVRLTAPMPDDFPNRQLITGVSVLFEDHSLVIEVKNPYTFVTDGCRNGVSPCLADGGLRIVVDGLEDPEVLRPSMSGRVLDGGTKLFASNLPVECRQFGGDRVWGVMYEEMVAGLRELAVESFEEWILRFKHMAAPEWCAKYIQEQGLAVVQSDHAIFRIDTLAVTIRLIAGINKQGQGEMDWDGRILPDLDFWQMDIGFEGLSVDHNTLSGILGETARPVVDDNGHDVMKGLGAMRGTVADYQVSDALGTDFALLHTTH